MNLKKGITHLSVALEKVQKLRIQKNFRHRGKLAGLILRASQQTSQTSHHMTAEQSNFPPAICP
jgi:hypothetical protein